mgnify:CR=1 FL=1
MATTSERKRRKHASPRRHELRHHPYASKLSPAPEPENEYTHLTKAWAFELSRADPQQQLFAKKAISDIIFEAQLGTLNRYSVIINATHVHAEAQANGTLPPVTLQLSTS